MRTEPRRAHRFLLAAALLPTIIGGCAAPSAPATPAASGTPSRPAESLSTPPPSNPHAPSTADAAGWRLVWSDEFDGAEIDRTHWTARDRSTFGEGNHEVACLMDRPENLRVTGGTLIITARSEDEPVACGRWDHRFPEGRHYTSGFVESRGKVEFEYGRFEVRARLPVAHGTTRGLWPAFWMRPGDLSLGELDVMEAVGSGPEQPDGSAQVFHTIHYDYENTHPQQSRRHELGSGSLSEEFHTFAVEWAPGSLRWYVDERLTFTRTTATTPWLDEAFSGPFFLRLNLAVGGTWPGEPDSDTVFPAHYVIDHVRVYQR